MSSAVTDTGLGVAVATTVAVLLVPVGTAKMPLEKARIVDAARRVFRTMVTRTESR
jgi:hypothetical protein